MEELNICLNIHYYGCAKNNCEVQGISRQNYEAQHEKEFPPEVLYYENYDLTVNLNLEEYVLCEMKGNFSPRHNCSKIGIFVKDISHEMEIFAEYENKVFVILSSSNKKFLSFQLFFNILQARLGYFGRIRSS